MLILSALARHWGRRWWVYVLLGLVAFYVFERPMAKKVVKVVVEAAVEAWHDLSPGVDAATEASKKAGEIKKNLEGKEAKKPLEPQKKENQP